MPGVYVSKLARASVIAHIALSEDKGMCATELADMTNISQSAISKVVGTLERVDFVEKHASLNQLKKPGRPPSVVVARDELYEAITMNPLWQNTIRLCVLATELSTTAEDAITAAVFDYSSRIGISSPADLL